MSCSSAIWRLNGTGVCGDYVEAVFGSCSRIDLMIMSLPCVRPTRSANFLDVAFGHLGLGIGSDMSRIDPRYYCPDWSIC